MLCVTVGENMTGLILEREIWMCCFLNCRGRAGAVSILSISVSMATQLAKTLRMLLCQRLLQCHDSHLAVLFWTCLLCPHRPNCAESSANGWQEWWVVPGLCQLNHWMEARGTLQAKYPTTHYESLTVGHLSSPLCMWGFWTLIALKSQCAHGYVH